MAEKEEISAIYTVFIKGLSAEARNELFTRFFFFTESLYLFAAMSICREVLLPPLPVESK